MTQARLTWDDLVIADPALDHGNLFDDWAWLVSGPFRPVIGTKFGDWFVERPNGSIEMLDMVEGSLLEVAPSRAELDRMLNAQENQEHWLLSELVWVLHQNGRVPGPGECYAFRVPPVLGGSLDWSNVEVMDLRVWVSICGQLHRQVKSMPPGTKISGFTVGK